MGVAGACSRQELCDLTLDDIEDRDSLIIIHISKTKTKIERTFTVTQHQKEEILFVEIYRKYLGLRPENATLKNQKAYTGYVFRRTLATLLANKGVDVLDLKRYAGWRFSTVTEAYVEESIENNIQYASQILHNQKIHINADTQDPGPSSYVKAVSSSSVHNSDYLIFQDVPVVESGESSAAAHPTEK
ncbi:hypothetical protein ILUMI_12463 [Ignelater luminosus]|uniref:Tyr recombinase domain-containing protein n=1 Tax=Ignelater luminosus TaxID=2038154 RepID=A0A8K0D2S8_IGNLU|nr:hypothetical protein ILUMI_12463 [Ignelater luminosus]